MSTASAALRMRPGRPYPLGATWDGVGVNVALFSEHATGVEICLFDAEDHRRETRRTALRERTDWVWHGYFHDLRPGQLYAYRVHGPYNPKAGHRFNPAKLLFDPYAKAISGAVNVTDAMYGYRREHADDLLPDDRDSAPFLPKSVVVDPAFDWDGDRPPRIPWAETVIYEMHVKGFTALHAGVPASVRGTYAGLAAPAAVDYLARLGITAVELLPIHHAVTERTLADSGLSNYWGYNSIGFFAPDSRFAATGADGQQVAEFKSMVKALHRAGLEVILDVVYNHTAEGHQLGPTLCFRGIDNAAYYRLADDRRHFLDYTGCGNTLNMMHPRALQLVMDSLRYWILEMHVDGFRFDLAPALAREPREVDLLSAFFDVINQDPVISQVKLIAEPWDLGEGGYHVGNFPVGWAEWNGKYRDAVRRFWKGDEWQAGEFVRRVLGSRDLYAPGGRGPCASINYATAHDGFTLADLVSYERKHNELNGEDNRDGTDDNASWNCGVEGPSDDPHVIELRQRQMRNLLATVCLSLGVPMLCAGDEIARTQAGNNNAYCQDNEVSWIPWLSSEAHRPQLEFLRALLRLRREHPVFRRRTFPPEPDLSRAGAKAYCWFGPDGQPLPSEPDRSFRCLGLRLDGAAHDEVDERGKPLVGQTFLVLFNADHASLPFALPADETGRGWEVVLDTRTAEVGGEGRKQFPAGGLYDLGGHCLAILRRHTAEEGWTA